MHPGPATVLVDDADGVRRITLRRPPVNALSLREHGALERAFSGAGAARVVLLQAEGTTWCAGQDLHELADLAGPQGQAAYLRRAIGGLVAAARCPVPVVAALHGPAVGTGALLAACCDVVVGTPAASLTLPELRLGLRLGRSLLADVLPRPVVTHLLATGAPLGAARLHELGFLAELVAPDELTDRTAAVLADLLALEDEDRRWLRHLPRREELARDYLEEVAGADGGR